MDLQKIEAIVTTQLKIRVPKLTEYQYTKMTFTNDSSDKIPGFPNVYVHEMESTELGNDLENNHIHALRSTIQIIVSANTTKSDAKIVSDACIKAMKALRYTATMMPVYNKDNNVHKYVFRVRRVIASGDTF